MLCSFLINHNPVVAGCVLLLCWRYFLVKVTERGRVLAMAKKTRWLTVIAATGNVSWKGNHEHVHEQLYVGPDQQCLAPRAGFLPASSRDRPSFVHCGSLVLALALV